MSQHAMPSIERHCDVILVGDAAANLAAALELSRQGHSVIVVAPHAEVRAEYEEIRSHGAEVLTGRVCTVMPRADGLFLAELEGGHRIVARRAFVVDGVEGQPSGRNVSASFPPANQADWDQRYSGDQIWSGNPNGSLVVEAATLRPGRALDVGAGEGGDAIWLAEQGWKVTASDISLRALTRIAAEASRREIDVTCLHADANAAEPFPMESFELVSAHYASIPRTPDNRAIGNLCAAVVPGGTLLVVGHDLEPMRRQAQIPGHVRPFDPDAYVRVEDVAGALAADPNWAIEVHEKRARPAGAIGASHHVDDIVLRAERRAKAPD